MSLISYPGNGQAICHGSHPSGRRPIATTGVPGGTSGRDSMRTSVTGSSSPEGAPARSTRTLASTFPPSRVSIARCAPPSPQLGPGQARLHNKWSPMLVHIEDRLTHEDGRSSLDAGRLNLAVARHADRYGNTRGCRDRIGRFATGSTGIDEVNLTARRCLHR